jgi:hypothetical protein
MHAAWEEAGMVVKPGVRLSQLKIACPTTLQAGKVAMPVRVGEGVMFGVTTGVMTGVG